MLRAHGAVPGWRRAAESQGQAMSAVWRRYEELRPDELEEAARRAPVAYWPLGLLEHHGWHLPIGFDGIKADRVCGRLAALTGGVVLPVMWWGWGGGHERFAWTHYQQREAAASVVQRTVGQLLANRMRVVVLLAGHYPWQAILDEVLPPLQAARADSLLLWGTEVSIGGQDLGLRGDHASLEETSFGLALLPDLVAPEALTAGRAEASWPDGPPPPAEQHPGVCFDPDSPRFAQMGEDPRQASAAHGEAGIAALLNHVATRIRAFLDPNAHRS